MTRFEFALTGQWSRGVSTACGGLALFVGVLVLAGWQFQVPTLKSILPGMVSMKPNTALAFVLAGAALALLAVSPRRARAGQWLALFVVLIGGVTLGEYLFGWHVGIDELLFTDDPNAIATTMPGRMAPSTAACFVLVGLALVGIGWEPRRGVRPAELLALVAAVVSVSSLVEYAVGQPIFFEFSQYTRMALHTAAGFAVLATGVLLARPDLGVVGGLRSGRVSLLEGSVSAAMGLVLLGVLAGGGWFYRAQEQQARRDVEANLEAIARLKADQIVRWRAERFGDAAVLMGGHFFAEGVARWLANPQAEDRDGILARFRSMQAYQKYDDVLLADARGQVRLSASDRPPALHAELVEALATASRTRQPVLTDLHRPPGDPTPHFDTIAPLLAGNKTTSEPIGAVILRQEARQFLYPLIHTWPTASLSAETLLVRRDGDAALFLNELRHRRDTAFTLRIPLTQQDVSAVMAVSGWEGVFRGVDYRGVKVLTVLKRIPDTSWIMVAKIDEAEALTEWRLRANLIVAVILVLGLLLAAAARMIWEQREKHRALSQSVELLRKANRAYRVLSECNQALVRADDELQLLHAVCQIVVEHGGYRLAWVGFAEEDEARTLRPVAQAGVEAGYLEGLQLTWADTERGRGPTGTAIRTGRSNVAQDILHDERFAPWRAEALRRGYAASVALPLTGQGRTFGVLGVYAAEPNAFDEQELKLLEELAGDLAFGIAALRLREDAAKAEEESAQARQDLRNSHELLDQTGRLAKVGGWQLDVDAQTVHWTEEVYRIHEIPIQPSIAGEDRPALVAAVSTADGIGFYAPEARPVIAAAVQAAIDAGTPFDLELPFVTAKGTRIWVRAQGIAERREGRTIRVYGAFQDITERRVAEESRRLQSAALYATADAIVITDRTGVIEWVNPAFTLLTGYTAEEALSKNPRDLLKSGKHAPAFYKELWETILAGRPWRGDTINRRKDGALYTDRQTITPILDVTGALTHFVAIKRDITERLHLEAQFRQAMKMEGVGQLASGIAHDFNNLLTVINGMAELVLEQVGHDDPVHADVQEIHRAGERAATLTRQLLAFSRQQILEPRVLNLNTVVAEMESLLRRLLGEDVDLVVIPASDLNSVMADPGQLGQVLINLAVNARDAMAQGGRLTIETTNVTVNEDDARQHSEHMPPGSYVRLAVSDSGIGMDEDTRARAFEPFFTTKGPGKGTGLGLSTVYGIVKQSQGFIGVYSEVGRGTTFTIYLPQVAEAAGADRPAAAAAPGVGTETILLVEDNAGLRKLATRVLEPAGYTVLGAGTAEEALRLMERHAEPVHLLVSDVVLPGMSGRLLAEQLTQTRPATKVLYMSGYTSDTVVRHGILDAHVQFLHKPFAAAALLRKVREVLDS